MSAIDRLKDGTNITGGDLWEAWQEALKTPAGDDPSRTIDAEEKAIFEGVEPQKLSWWGSYVHSWILEQIPSRFDPGTPPTGDAVPLAPEGSKRPVYLSPDGKPVLNPSQDAPASNEEAEEAWYRVALHISQRIQSGTAPTFLDSLGVAQKEALASRALAAALRTKEEPALEGLSEDQLGNMRSAAFTTLYALGRSLKGTPAEEGLKGDVHAALIQLANNEPHRWLGKHMARILDRPDYRQGLTSSQTAEVDAAFTAHHPKKFDVGNILDAEGYIQWDHACGHGENFFRSFVVNMKKRKLGNAKFKLVSKSWGVAEFELTFQPPRGKEGRVKGIRFRVREYNDDMFDAIGELKGFSYGGHSNIGQNQENSLEEAIRKGLESKNPQIALLDLCAGLDNIDDVMEAFQLLTVLTTFSSSFFWKGTLEDEDGSFEGVRRSEGMESLMAFLEGLSQEEDFEKIRSRVLDVIRNWQHSYNPNLVVPTKEDYRQVLWAHLDGDNDGRMDANDVFFQFGLKKAIRDASAEFELKDSLPFDELEGDAVKDAGLDVNVSSHYNSSTTHTDIEHEFIADGYFDGTDSNELVRFVPGENHDGSSAILIQVNSRLGHTSREALGALTHYLALMHGADNDLVHGLNEAERKVMGLTFAMFRLNNDRQWRHQDEQIWKQLLAAVNLPTDLPFGPLSSLVDAEHHDYAGNMKIVKDYLKQLSEAQIAALQDVETGRPASGPAIA